MLDSEEKQDKEPTELMKRLAESSRFYNELRDYFRSDPNNVSNIFERISSRYNTLENLENISLQLGVFIWALSNGKPQDKTSVDLLESLINYYHELVIEIEKMRRETVVSDEKMNNLTALTFHLLFAARGMRPDLAGGGKKNEFEMLYSNENNTCISALSKKVSCYDGWKILAGLALIVLGVGIVAVAGCSIAVSYGATSPFAITLAKFGLDAAVAGAVYVFAELFTALGARKRFMGETTPIIGKLLNGAGASAMATAVVSGVLPASASAGSALASAMTGSRLGLTATTPFGVLGVIGATTASGFMGAGMALRGLSLFRRGVSGMQGDAEKVAKLSVRLN